MQSHDDDPLPTPTRRQLFPDNENDNDDRLSLSSSQEETFSDAGIEVILDEPSPMPTETTHRMNDIKHTYGHWPPPFRWFIYYHYTANRREKTMLCIAIISVALMCFFAQAYLQERFQIDQMSVELAALRPADAQEAADGRHASTGALVPGVVPLNEMNERTQMLLKNLTAELARLNASRTQAESCQECMLASARILSRVNTDVNPCDDFYSFACGQWVQDFKLPAGKQHWDTHNSLAEKSHVTVKRILDGSIKVATSAEEMALLTKAQKYYETCMNTDHLNDVSVKPLIPLLEDIVDLFPYSLQPEDEGYAKKMAETVAFLASYNVSVFVDFKVNKYDNSMELWPAEFAMPLELYEYQNYLNRYTQIMASMLTNVMEHPAIRARGQAIRDEQITNWYAVATSLISFEQDLARMRANEEKKMKDGEYERRIEPLSTVDNKQLGLHWQTYFSALNGEVKGEKSKNSKFATYAQSNQTVAVVMPAYFESIYDMVQKVDPALARIYFFWNVIRTMAPHMGSSMQAIYTQLQWLVVDNYVAPEQWEKCVRETNEATGWIVGHFYHRHTLPAAELARAETLVSQLRHNISVASWKDVNVTIGRPAFGESVADLHAFYAGMTTDVKSYFSNVLAHRRFAVLQRMNKLTGEYRAMDDTYLPQSTEMVVDPKHKHIYVPAGFLQSPIYEENVPEPVVVGSLGTQLARALLLVNGAEPDDDTGKCLIQQYNGARFTDKDIHVDGRRTLKSNYVDMKALSSSWALFSLTPTANVTNQLLHYNDKQLFFLGYAQSMCSKSTQKFAVKQSSSSESAPEQVRVNMAMRNLPAFPDVFHCPSSPSVRTCN